MMKKRRSLRWPKNRSKMFFCYVFAMLVGGKAVRRRPPFCWVYVTFRFFGRPGLLLAQFGLDFGRFGSRFSKFLDSILEVSGHDLGPMRLVILVLFKAVLF